MFVTPAYRRQAHDKRFAIKTHYIRDKFLSIYHFIVRLADFYLFINSRCEIKLLKTCKK